MLVAQLSDLHVRAGTENRAVRAAVAAVAALQPDAVILTGDLADDARPGEYEALQALLAPFRVPVHAVPGNHDDREALRALFPALPRTGLLDVVAETRPVRLVGLDTALDGRVEGALRPATLDFLERTLAAAPDVPTLLFLHHLPCPVGVPHLDAIGLVEGAARFRDILRRHAQVERVVAGHYHRAIVVRFAGTVLQVAPSAAHATAVSFDAERAEGPVMQRPGLLLHRWTAEAGLVTHGGAAA